MLVISARPRVYCSPMLIDSHCHLDMLDTSEDFSKLADILALAKSQGVGRVLCIGVNLADFPRVYRCAELFSEVDCSFGLHPDEDGRAVSFEELLPHAALPKVVAIGETGLDFYREYHLENQMQNFKTQIELAKYLKKPLIIHTRAASVATMEMMQKEQASLVGGVMHCFTETWEVAKQALDLGFYISISGIVTFKNAEQIRQVARQVPLDRLLIETDAPYLAPVPYRGKPNQPAYVKEVAEYIANLRGLSFEALAEASTENYFRLFHRGQRDV